MTFTYDELEAAAQVADKMLAKIDIDIELATKSMTNDLKIDGVDVIEIKHGAWRIREREFWTEVARRFRGVLLAADPNYDRNA